MTRRLLFLLLLCLTACEEVIEPTAPVLPVAAVSASANSDRAALVALYEATNGPSWRNNENWLTDAPLGEWYGVSVNEDERVVKLDLTRRGYNNIIFGNNLVGEIPPELGNLSALQYLRLLGYEISGSIPPELGKLSELEDLYLVGHGLTGPIPPELGTLFKLKSLRVAGHGLTGQIPSELGNLSELEALYLGGGYQGVHSELSGTIPPELGNLSKLKVLDLRKHNLSGLIPSELSKLSALERLWLSDNNLSGPIPSELGKLSALEYLWLDDNTLTEIPPELGNLSALQRLWLSGNALTEIPPELGNLSVLLLLDLSGNPLSGPLPVWFLNLGSLLYLETEGTDLCVPGTGRFVQWQTKPSGYNSPAGSTPYCNATDKEVLKLIYNIMHGSNWNRSEGWMSEGPLLSDWHGITTDSLGHVVALELPGNNLRGRYFPGKIGNLTRLRTLDISNNPGIQGRVPAALKGVALETFRFRVPACVPPKNCGSGSRRSQRQRQPMRPARRLPIGISLWRCMRRRTARTGPTTRTG